AFCARASGLRVRSETNDSQSPLSSLSTEAIVKASTAGAKLQNSGKSYLEVPVHLLDMTITFILTSHMKYLQSTHPPTATIDALQEFSDGLGPHDLSAFDDSLSKSEPALSQTLSRIVFDHSHEYHGDTVVSGFVALPQIKNRQRSLSDFVAKALGSDIQTASDNDSSGIKIKRALNRSNSHQPNMELMVRGGNESFMVSTPILQSRSWPTPPPTFISDGEPSKPMTRLEMDIAEAVATPSPAVASMPMFSSVTAASLGIHPSLESVHEAVISSSRRASMSSPRGLGFQGTDSERNDVQSSPTFMAASPLESSPQQSPSSPLSLVNSTLITKNISTGVSANQQQQQDIVDRADESEATGCNNNSPKYPVSDCDDKQSDDKAISSTSSTSLSLTADSNVMSRRRRHNNSDSTVDEYISSGNDSDDQIGTNYTLNPTNPSVGAEPSSTSIFNTYSNSGSDSGSGYDYGSGSCSSDSATEQTFHEERSLDKQRMKHRRRRLLVDDAKHKQEQLERVKAQLQLKTLGKIREQVSFWEEKSVLEQKTVAVVEVDEDEDEPENTAKTTAKTAASTNIDTSTGVKQSSQGLIFDASLMHLRLDHGDTKGNTAISVITNPSTSSTPSRIQQKLDKLMAESISPGNCQSPEHPDAPRLAPHRKSLGNNEGNNNNNLMSATTADILGPPSRTSPGVEV
ncbi:hypothetical protein BGX26_003219, partial [Mortierella sp. AD094]